MEWSNKILIESKIFYSNSSMKFKCLYLGKSRTGFNYFESNKNVRKAIKLQPHKYSRKELGIHSWLHPPSCKKGKAIYMIANIRIRMRRNYEALKEEN